MTPLLLGLAVAAAQPPFPYQPTYPFNPLPQQPVPQAVPQPLPAPSPLLPAVGYPVPALTLAQFVAVFQPVPGTHKVTIIHPKTGVPHEICFTLPPGCPKVKSGKLYVEFNYGKHEVEIRFRCLSGRVDVKYN